MRLQQYSADLETKLSEFDMWVTPALGEIRDTQQFEDCLSANILGLELLSSVTDDFSSLQSCSPNTLAEKISARLLSQPSECLQNLFISLTGVLLLATGKTDNNLKCQFPIKLKNEERITSYSVRKNRGWGSRKIPRVLDVSKIAEILSKITEKESEFKKIISTYCQLIISDENYANQVFLLGQTYINAKHQGVEKVFLTPMTIFQARGSITANQGHIPEIMLRNLMKQWGLLNAFDYNEQDVALSELSEGVCAARNSKKRKFDFVLPYKSRSVSKRLFIQSQFYAGDSGSVSHKVVDQTDSSRSITLTYFPDAIFLEYLDGAGYTASLNTDLKKMLEKHTTKDFFQIKSAPLKLRRELQEIGFLTPLEIEHAIIRSTGRIEDVKSILTSADNYSDEEVELAISSALEKGIIESTGNSLSIANERIPTVRQYCLLDTIANFGTTIPLNQATGVLIVPGYSASWGMRQDNAISKAIETFPHLQELWTRVEDAFNDIQALLDSGFIKLI